VGKLAKLTDRLAKLPGMHWRSEETMTRYGIRNVMRLAKSYNRWRYGKRARQHEHAFATEIEALLKEHAGHAVYPPRIVMQDGWAIDTSRSLPGLEQVLAEAGDIARERAGKKHSDVQQPYFRNLFFYEDIHKYPALLNFALSGDVLATVAQYLQTIPVMSKTKPPGIRYMESNQNLDPNPPGPFAASQLYHLDLHDSPLVYVLLLIEDVTFDHGPWTFLPISVSERAKQQLGYQKRGRPYRITDEEMYGPGGVDPKEAIVFSYPKGTVLFIDSSRCFHYGSRNSIKPRLQLMYAYTSVSRCDLSQTWMPSFPYPVQPTDSRLRRMVLE